MKKLILSSFLIATSFLPAFAGINGGISHDSYYDLEKTIMAEFNEDLTVKSNVFWDKNYFFSNRFSPASILSNKNLLRQSRIRKNTELRLQSVPTVYNVSFKSATIKAVGFENKTQQRESFNATNLFETAKSSNDIEEKINATLKLKTSHPDLALSLLENILSQNPESAHAYYLKGEIYFYQKDFTKSMENYTQALSLNPYSVQSCIGIAKILDRTNTQLAQKYYSKAEQLKKQLN